jgi:hypothetical protein
MKSGLQKYRCMIVSYLILVSVHSFAQSGSKDLKDILNQLLKSSSDTASDEIVVGKTLYTLVPFIGYAPANGFVAGGAASLTRLFGLPPTNISTGMFDIQATTKKQVITNARTKIYLKGNKWFMQGDWRLLIFTQPTYGLGIQNPGDPEVEFHINRLQETGGSWGEPMKYNQFRFYEDISRRIGNSNFYVGLGVAIDQHFSINDERLDTTPGSPDFYITNHYAYSVKNNFNLLKYGNNGIKLMLLTDTRDNIGNCYKGYFASASMVYNIKIGNNSQQNTRILYEAMYFLGLSKMNPRHVLAFWSWGSFLMQGNTPYLALPAIGWDTYNRSGRGFIQGRYRGLNMMYNEAEYRFPVSKNGLFGGALFVNATTVSSYEQKLFEKIAAGLGGGIRIQFDNRSRTNLGIDFGMGSDRSRGIYFNLQETF